MTLFNSKGELNAGSHSEAIQLITKLASILQDGQSVMKNAMNSFYAL